MRADGHDQLDVQIEGPGIAASSVGEIKGSGSQTVEFYRGADNSSFSTIDGVERGARWIEDFDGGLYGADEGGRSGGTRSIGIIQDREGNVGIGAKDPGYGLDVVDDINSDDCFREAGAQVAGTCTSDIRLKKNIKPLQGSLDKILELEPVEFEWKEGIDELGGTIRYVEGRQVGLVAQDVEPVLPHLVHERNGYLSVEYNLEMQMMLVNAIQELKEENQELKQLICLDHPEEEICQ